MSIRIILEIVQPQQPNKRKIYYITNDIRETSCNRIKHVLIWKLIINSYLFRQHFIRFFDRATCHQSILILSALKLHKRRRNIHTYICMNTVILIQLAIMKNLVFEQKKRNKLYSMERHNFHNFWKRMHWFEVLINVGMDFHTRIHKNTYYLNTKMKSSWATIH